MNKKTALVTGASRGIGNALTKCLQREGIRVLTPSRKELDLASSESVSAYLTSLHESVDILVNNAGINILSPIAELSDDNITQTVQVNMVSPLMLVRGVVKGMIERRFGRIINISSIWSQITKPKRVTYSMTKSGLNGMTRTLAVELAPYNILVNAIAPGYVSTELTKQNNSDKEIDLIRQSIPMRRLADPEEIAEIAVFLASGKNTYITGQVIIADGGFICQ
jgi:3-oxoacyl-[acyl-carrier protein] reductase